MYDIFSVSISTSIIILLLILARPLLCKFYKAKLRYFIWLFVAIRLLIPFNIALDDSVINISPHLNIGISAPLEQTAAPIQTEIFQTEGNRSPTLEPFTAALSINDIIFIVWGAGVVVFLLYHMIGYILFRRKVNAWSKVIENNKPRIAVCKQISSPMLFGMVRPTILLPDLDYSQNDLDMIIAHETVHYQRKDIWYKLVLLLATAIHWFNPVVYWMAYYANKDLEFSCDEIVVQNRDMDYKKAYSQSILHAICTEKGSALSTYFKGGKKDIKERFSNILMGGKKKRGILLFAVVLLATLLSGMLVACNTTSQDDKFGFLSAEWGTSWDDVQKDTGLTGEVQEENGTQVAQIGNVEYLGTTGTAVFQLDNQLDSAHYGLDKVIFIYDDADEEKLMTELENIYGERKNTYTDKNGIENPIEFSGGWVSEETIEGSMTEAEKEKYIELMGDIAQSRKDVILRSPVVTITVDEERNIIEFNGSGAVTVNYVKENNT